MWKWWPYKSSKKTRKKKYSTLTVAAPPVIDPINPLIAYDASHTTKTNQFIDIQLLADDKDIFN